MRARFSRRQNAAGPTQAKPGLEWATRPPSAMCYPRGTNGTSDASGQTAPRELIHLLNAAKDAQLRQLEIGTPEPVEEMLIDRTALKEALPEVSKVRFEQTLCAEYPALKPRLMKLEGQKTDQNPESLAQIWGVSRETAATAEKLVEVGFFERRGTREQPTFWVPFLYRGALKMVQGKAD